MFNHNSLYALIYFWLKVIEHKSTLVSWLAYLFKCIKLVEVMNYFLIAYL